MSRDQNSDTARFGSVTIRKQAKGGSSAPNNKAAASAIYTWRPPKHLRRRLEPNFKIAFECYETSDGQRSFAPVDGGHIYVHEAFKPGIEILRDAQDLTDEQHYSYLAMRLVFDRVRSMHAHRGRQFDAARDLYVRPRGRAGDIQGSLLPKDVGLDRDGQGIPWSIAQLTQHGREVARGYGVAHATYRQAVHYGLAAAALLRPLRVSDAEVPALMRLALFDTRDGLGRPDAELVEVVMERLLRAVHQHQADSNTKFFAWYMPGKGNLPKTLAGGKGSPGGRLKIEDVNRVLMDQGWESYGYVAKCLRAFAHFFRRSLPQQLSTHELTRFEHIYLPQPCYGNLPLPLILERGSFLQSIVMQLWEQPTDSDLIGALHRLLSWYAELAEPRREADRRFKNKAVGPQGAKVEFTGSETVLMMRAVWGASDDDEQLFAHIVAKLASLRGLTCLSCADEWTGLRANGSALESKSIQIEITCKCGRVQSIVTTTMEELKRIAKSLEGDDERRDD